MASILFFFIFLCFFFLFYNTTSSVIVLSTTFSESLTKYSTLGFPKIFILIQTKGYNSHDVKKAVILKYVSNASKERGLKTVGGGGGGVKSNVIDVISCVTIWKSLFSCGMLQVLKKKPYFEYEHLKLFSSSGDVV